MTPTADPGRPNPTRGPERRARSGRQTMAAGNVMVVMLVCLLVWTFLFAPTLKRAAEASPDGLRRTAALAVLTPFTALGNALRVTRLTDAVERALGRDPDAAPGGEIVIPPGPIPSPSAGGGGSVDGSGPIRTPTPADKLRVVVIGDSLAAGLGTYMERVLKPSLVRISQQGRISTGLARPDYFDWPAAMQLIVDNFRPDLIVVMLGENDNQALQTSGGQLVVPVGTSAWPPAYRGRVEDFMRIATSRGARVVWVGLPNIRDAGRLELIRRQNLLFRQAAKQVKDVAFLDTWKLFAGPNGSYTAYHRSGDTVELVREPDGIHFNPAGYELLARLAIGLAEKRFELTSKAVNP